jgi:hypothetical protein
MVLVVAARAVAARIDRFKDESVRASRVGAAASRLVKSARNAKRVVLPFRHRAYVLAARAMGEKLYGRQAARVCIDCGVSAELSEGAGTFQHEAALRRLFVSINVDQETGRCIKRDSDARRT